MIWNLCVLWTCPKAKMSRKVQAASSEAGLRVLHVAGDDADGIDVGIELAGDAVYEADGAAHEEQLDRDAPDAGTQLQAEPPEVAVSGLLPLAPEPDADEAEQGGEGRLRAELEPGLLQRRERPLEVAFFRRQDNAPQALDEI